MIEDVQEPPIRKAKAGRTRAGQPGGLPDWYTQTGDVGGLRFKLTRLEPSYRSWPARVRPIAEDEIERNGPGIYEVQAEKQGSDQRWRRYGDPRQVTIDAPADWSSPWAGSQAAPLTPKPEGSDISSLLVGLLRERMAQPEPRNPYELQSGPAIPAESLDELRRAHREQIAQMKADHASNQDQIRLTMQDRIDTAKGMKKASDLLFEGRIAELESRSRRLEDDLSSSRNKRTDSLGETIKALDAVDKLRDRMTGSGATEEDAGPWGAILKSGILERFTNPQPAPGYGPAPGYPPPAGLPAATPEAAAQAQAHAQEQEQAQRLQEAKLALVGALEALFTSGASAGDAFATIAPQVSAEAFSAAAGLDPDQFAADIVRPSSQTSPLRDPEAVAWLRALHGLVKRVNGPDETGSQQAT